jgi:hypothetical protein
MRTHASSFSISSARGITSEQLTLLTTIAAAALPRRRQSGRSFLESQA